MSYLAIITDTNTLDSYVMEVGDLPEGWTSVELPSDFNPECQHWDIQGSEVVSCYADSEQLLAQSVAIERQTLSSEYTTSGENKSLVYAYKANEVRSYRRLTQTAINTLSVETLKEDYPFLYWDAQAHGDSIADSLARFEAGITATISNLAMIEAAYQKAKLDISHAETLEEKRAVATLPTDYPPPSW
ncbi:hypothetical protein PF049_00225 [Erythrobacteraceae bacterium WH01K]|nr:hypothetical protein PF049_00225 [Erythrobacteraceae bacterium WH01K]